MACALMSVFHSFQPLLRNNLLIKTENCFRKDLEDSSLVGSALHETGPDRPSGGEKGEP